MKVVDGRRRKATRSIPVRICRSCVETAIAGHERAKADLLKPGLRPSARVAGRLHF
jgi:hypothetical protein